MLNGDFFILIFLFLQLLLITYLIRGFARGAGIVNKPNAIIPQHTHAIAYMGGIAIAVNMLFLFWVVPVLFDIELYSVFSEYWLIISLMFLAFGFFDDLMNLKASKKLFFQITLAIVSVYYSGVNEVSMFVFGVFWIVLLVNSYNFLDVMDGLVGGIAIVFFVSMIFIDFSNWQIYLVVVASIVAFMFFNSPPASMFMGDAGSHFLGYLVAVFTLDLLSSGSENAIVSVFLLVIVPLFELVFITCIRLKKGLSWWKGSPDHMALRLQESGLGKWKTNFVIWSLAIAMSLLAYFSSFYNGEILLTLYVLAVLLFVFFSYYLLKWEVEVKVS